MLGLRVVNLALFLMVLPSFVRFRSKIMSSYKLSPDESLRIASRSDNLDEIIQLFECHGIDIVKAKDEHGWTALHHASECSRLKVVQYLIETTSTGIHDVNKDGDTPLHTACRSGHLEIVKYLVETAGMGAHYMNVRIITHHCTMQFFMASWKSPNIWWKWPVQTFAGLQGMTPRCIGLAGLASWKLPSISWKLPVQTFML
jgi:ankyrin repeat protein